MKPAVWPPAEPLKGRLLCLEPRTGHFEDRRIGELPRLLRRGDLLVVNDAATLPACLHATTSAGEPIEVRLAARQEREEEWTAALFGRGDWRMRTEDRPLPPLVAAGDLLHFGDDFRAKVRRIWPVSPRLVDLIFDRRKDELWQALYRRGYPIQYSYLRKALALWHVQTAYGARPWAVEPPSAGLPLNWDLLGALRKMDVAIASVTHAAGLSSTGDAAVDALLPLPEHFEIPAATVEAVEKTHAEGGRVVAVGTSVVRALEGSAAEHGGRLKAGTGVTDLRIGAGSPLRVVDGLLTGLHEPGTSHFALLAAFSRQDLLMAASRHAEASGYLGHEFGDSMLILGEDPSARVLAVQPFLSAASRER